MTKARSVLVSIYTARAALGTYKGIGNIGGCVKDGQATCQFTTPVECCEVINDKREETRLSDTQKEAKSKEPAKILDASRQQSHGTKGEHENWKNSGRAVLLANYRNWWSKNDIRYKED